MGNFRENKAKKEAAGTQGTRNSAAYLYNDLRNGGVIAGWGDGNVASLSPAQVEQALGIHANYSVTNADAWTQLRALQAAKLNNDYMARAEEMQAALQERYAEMLGGMAESSAAMAEALNKPVRYEEPAKQAEAAASKARADTEQRQLMRRGLLSLTRWGDNGTAPKSSSLGVA